VNAKILLVESDLSAAGALTDTLALAGYLVLANADPTRALALARDELPDLIVLDLTLPGGGAALLSDLGRSAQTSAIPVLAIAESESAAGEAMRMGARAVLNKPVLTADLLAAVAGAVMEQDAIAGAPPSLLSHPPRLEALRSLGLLDTPAEEIYDRVTRIASQLLEVPVSLVSLVDVERQFFASQVGLGEPFATERQTPLSHSFCQFTVTYRKPFVVVDARHHPLVAANLAVTEMGVAAYAGVPLITKSGQAIGSLCAIDEKPHHWTDADIAALTDLAAVLMELFELRRGIASEPGA